MRRWFGRRGEPDPPAFQGLAGTPLTFDTRAWQQVENDAWMDANGDAALINFFGVPPDLPASLDNRQALRERTSHVVASHGAGLVELDVVALDGVGAVCQIIKTPIPDQEHGRAYIGSFTVPRATCSVVLRTQCVEHPPTGMRDSVVLMEYTRQREPEGVSMDQIMAEWAQHPYASGVQGGVPRNHSEDEAWDGQFPQHPLSRARRGLRTLAASVTLDQVFKELPPFRGSAA